MKYFPQPFILLICLALTYNNLAADEFNFDISSYKKQNYHFSGYLEYSLNHQIINQDAAATDLLFINTTPLNTLTQHSGILDLKGNYKGDKWQASFNFHSQTYNNELANEQINDFYEALVSYQPDTTVTLVAGKKSIKWGKGYAWNPVGFVERPKNQDDPDLSREGYIVATADIIKSLNGDLQTLAFTPVILPVTEDINNDFGLPDYNNIAAKLYLLYKNTDIDFVFLNEASRSQRYGFDFAKNITTNFELHGEWVYLDEISKNIVLSNGTITTSSNSTTQWLLGLRYLTENETTIIAEYYKNNSGYSAKELQDFFNAVNVARSTNNTILLNSLLSIGEKSYLKRNPGKEYLYLRLSNKEPFDWLYLNPSISFIYNINDYSASLSPELVYTGFKNLELRIKATLLYGDNNTDFSEKRNEKKYEFRIRYFF